MIDVGLVMYCGLIFLGIWRALSMWRMCGKALVWANYCMLGYIVALVLLTLSLVEFFHAALTTSGKQGWWDLPSWMHPFVLGAPFACIVSYCLNAFQTAQHVNEIRKCNPDTEDGSEVILRHDRAVQIVALPAVYGVMAMGSLSRMYNLFTKNLDASTAGMDEQEIEQLYISKSETCFWVGDFYEAWALFLFGQLTLGLIKQAVETNNGGPLIQRAYTAVERLAWMGVTLFLVVCILQAGWSLYLLIFTDVNFTTYNTKMNQFKAAGMVASAAAIYNVHSVESTFHHELENYRPLLKFITVKIIVSFAFFQKGTVNVLQAFCTTFPGPMQTVVHAIPALGDILYMSDTKFEIFYASLILYECILISLLHFWGWNAYEDWYKTTSSTDVEDQKPQTDEPPTTTFSSNAAPAGTSPP